MNIDEIIHTEHGRLLILYDRGQEEIVRVVADIVGQSYLIVDAVDAAVGRTEDTVIGIDNRFVLEPAALAKTKRTIITTHAIDGNDFRNEDITSSCEYEYLYSSKHFSRRTLCRYLAFILGQVRPHDEISSRERTTLLSTTFPDIRAALPNLDILSVGADALELRVDLLEERALGGEAIPLPSIKYVGEQLMLLKQRTELPVVFTTRCTKENGRFPMDDPMLFYRYLRKAVQWGCEYIDVELWLPDEVRSKLANRKGRTKIMSAWHDFTGLFSWSSQEAKSLLERSAQYADVVKMVALASSAQQNYELEHFRSRVQSETPNVLLCALNMGEGAAAQLSRGLNRVLTPITHPLVPRKAAPGQLSAADINVLLHSMGQLEKQNIFAVGRGRANGQAMFFEKCMNELGLPHEVTCVDSLPGSLMDSMLEQPGFGGAHFNPALPVLKSSGMPQTSTAAASIGYADTIITARSQSGRMLVCENASWRGIRATLLHENVPSAYADRPALVLASTEAQAASVLFALKDLGMQPIYSIGFYANSHNGVQPQQFRSAEDMKRVDEPFVIVNALPAERSHAVTPLLKHYSRSLHRPRRLGKIFLDLSAGTRSKGNNAAIAAQLGWRSFGTEPVNAHTMVETLRLLLGVNVGYDFVKLASGRCLLG